MPIRLCAFAGSSPGFREEYAQATRELGHQLASRGIGLVFGGANRGLMGILADAVLKEGGHVIGVIPEALVAKEVAHPSLPDLRIVGSMHERKALMAELSQGFVALPGGLGTFEELLEMLTWAQLGVHAKPCGVLNVAGYFDPLLTLLDRAVVEGFLKQEHRQILLVETLPARLLDAFDAYKPLVLEKWIDRSRT